MLNGTLNELLAFNAIIGVETAEYLKANLAKFGGPESFGHYSFGWAHAMDTAASMARSASCRSTPRSTARITT